MKYSDKLMDWLVELGYRHCFYVSGGNIMHLLESASRRFECHSVIHEVAAGIAVEYFNEVSTDGRAFALVTAGPGLTNITTAVAGAYLESRELLVIGGQVKTADLCRQEVRQRGIQEIDGVDIMRPITVGSTLIDGVLDQEAFTRLAEAGSHGRKGPVFLEIPLDVQGRDVDPAAVDCPAALRRPAAPASPTQAELERLAAAVRGAKRPLLLLGGGVSRQTARECASQFTHLGIPIATTWNGADRIGSDHPLYVGRPNTWGQRSANLILQQSDFVIALGTRLGMQQTGFNWQAFVPNGRAVQVDCDKAELGKGHPRVDWPIHGDANRVLRHLCQADLGRHTEWVAYCRQVREALPLVETTNKTGEGYVSPYEFDTRLSQLCDANDIVIPCSSGGSFTVPMQTFLQKSGQIMVSNKGLASMGYGLSGAIGAAFAGGGRRVVVLEGDGGFAQNLQEVGTVMVNRLNVKIFVFDDSGYGSIRMTQRNYFGGRYVGCDRKTGLGLPDWEKLFAAYDMPVMRLDADNWQDAEFKQRFAATGPAAFIVTVDPEQTYFPKITSRVTESGSMESNPLHLMSPPLDVATMQKVGRYLIEVSVPVPAEE